MKMADEKPNGDLAGLPAPPIQQTRVERRKEKTMRALIEVALALFYEKGIYWTKIEDITARADVGKGTFYLYFDTKEAILLAVLQQGLDRLLGKMMESAEKATSGLGLISAAIRSQLDFYLDHPEYLLLFHQVCGLLQLKTGAVKELKSAYDAHLNKLGRLIQPALNGKGRRPSTARELAMALSAITSGLLTHHLLFGKVRLSTGRRVEIQREIERSVRALL